MPQTYTLAIIGAGAAGRMAAVKAAYMGHKVAVIDGFEGAISPFERLWATTLKLGSLQNAGLVRATHTDHEVKENFTPEQLAEAQSITRRVQNLFYNHGTEADAAAEVAAIQSNLSLKNITCIPGFARFENIDEIEITSTEPGNAGKQSLLEAGKILIATGSRVRRPAHIPFNGTTVHCPSTIFNVPENADPHCENSNCAPESILIEGGHILALQFAVAFSLMGTHVTLVAPEKTLFPFLDTQVREALMPELLGYGIDWVQGAHTESVALTSKGSVRASLSNGQSLGAAQFLYADAYEGFTEKLDAEAIGIDLDEHGFIQVNEDYQTSIPHIYAVGDCVHSPILESTRAFEGLQAVNAMFGLKDPDQVTDEHPSAIYTLPQMGMYGPTEDELRARHIPYIAGIAEFKDTPLGRMLGLETGFLKLLVSKETEEVLAVHAFGHASQEFVHFGMQFIEDRKSVGKIIGTVLNGGTFHELYRLAAIDAVNKLRK